MLTPGKEKPQFEIGHVLFIDVIGYSKRLLDDQRDLQQQLNQVVKATASFRKAETENQLVRLPTGDGMALVFFNSPEEPVRCALEISEALKESPLLRVRMGINTGPVGDVEDVNDRSNIAGAGINIAQRVMDVGDAGHILLSKRAAEDLLQYRQWEPSLHDLGEFEVKHGVKVSLVNLYTEKLGNPQLPKKLEQERHKELGSRRVRRALLVGLTLVGASVLVAGSFIVSRRTSSRMGDLALGIPEKSIAVLPFESLSEEKENAYFADGVQDDILTDLAKVADLKVISRRSVAQYRETKKTAREIGQALQVRHILEGSVRKAAGKIRVTAQLIDARSEAQIWGEKYDRDLADVFAIQSEIAQAIVTHLQAALSPAEKAAIEQLPTRDQDAYDLYLHARALVHEFGTFVKPGQENHIKAVTLLESAIARDPNFTLAYCLLSEAQLSLYGIEYWNRERLPKARAAVDAALRISPDSGEAHLALANYYYLGARDAEGAEKELAIAFVELPGRADVFRLAGDIAAQRGQWETALRDGEKAIELDPRDPETATWLVMAYSDVRRYSEAERLIDRIVTSLPQQMLSRFWRQKSAIALAKGDTKRAMAALDSSPNRHLGLVGLNSEVANVFFFERDYARAAEILETVEEVAIARNVLPKEGMQGYGRGLRLERLGRIARAQNQKEKARDYFESARPSFEEWLAKNPEELSEFEGRARGYIAEIDVALGRKEEGVREARRAVELWPQSRDARVAPQVANFLAIAYTWAGEHEAALELLTSLVKLPAGPTYGDLKLNPVWDDLRGDPRFEAMVASLKPNDRM